MGCLQGQRGPHTLTQQSEVTQVLPGDREVAQVLPGDRGGPPWGTEVAQVKREAFPSEPLRRTRSRSCTQ